MRRAGLTAGLLTPATALGAAPAPAREKLSLENAWSYTRTAGSRGRDRLERRAADPPRGQAREWLEDTGFRVAGPHHGLFVDPCEYAVELIG